MTIKKLLRIGDPVLLQKSGPVEEFNTSELDQLIQDLFDTMKEFDGAGIAAPQIGVLQRVVVFDVKDNPRYPGRDPVPRTVLINPTIDYLSQEIVDDWEGCLSVPGMRGLVPRHTHIRYTGYDQNGGKIDREVKGFHARVVQHECDHLYGVLYPQRITDMTKFGYKDELFPDEAITT
jgi:peptide deformylase